MSNLPTQVEAMHRADAVAAPIGERIAATFVSPGRLADLLRAAPRWLDVLLISTLIAVAAAAILPPDAFVEASNQAVTRRGEPVEITSSPEEIVRWGRYLAMLSAAVGHPLVAFALAGLLTLVFTIVPRGPISFVRHLALASHALLVSALGALVGLGLKYGLGQEDAHLSLALFTPFIEVGSPVRDVLALISPFTVWMLVIIAVGVARLDPRRTIATTAGVLLGGYTLLALLLAS